MNILSNSNDKEAWNGGEWKYDGIRLMRRLIAP